MNEHAQLVEQLRALHERLVEAARRFVTGDAGTALEALGEAQRVLVAAEADTVALARQLADVRIEVCDVIADLRRAMEAA